MPYIKIELEFLSHPKTITLPPLAQLLFFRSIIYCAEHLTDGILPQASPLLLGYDMQGETEILVENLEKIGWWKPLKGGGWQIHDYLDHQLSRAEVTQLIVKKKKAGKAGGRASAQARATAPAQAESNDSSTNAQAESNDSSTNAQAESNISVSVSVPLDVSVSSSVDLKEKTKSSREGKTSRPAKSAASWKAYSHAYNRKYGRIPDRTEAINSMLCKLVDNIGIESAPEVAAFYLTHNGQYYMQKMHPVNLLLSDAQKLKTEWITGKKMTGIEARGAEQQDAAREQVKRVEGMLKGNLG